MPVALIAAALLAAAPAPADRFELLKPLVGEWVGTGAGGRQVRIDYRLIANGSVLVETWRTASGRETMTVFHHDGPAVIATHYCAQGNQPRLVLTGGDARHLPFVFRDATNLAGPDASHQHAFAIDLADPGAMTRTETYRAGGRDETETLTLRRAQP